MTTDVPSSKLERVEMRVVRLLLLLLKRSGDKKVQWMLQKESGKEGQHGGDRVSWVGASEDLCPIRGQVEDDIHIKIC
jgi:hypothetical protein